MTEFSLVASQERTVDENLGIDYSVGRDNAFCRTLTVFERTKIFMAESRTRYEVLHSDCSLITMQDGAIILNLTINRGTVGFIEPGASYFYQTLRAGDAQVQELIIPDLSSTIENAQQ